MKLFVQILDILFFWSLLYANLNHLNQTGRELMFLFLQFVNDKNSNFSTKGPLDGDMSFS